MPEPPAIVCSVGTIHPEAPRANVHQDETVETESDHMTLMELERRRLFACQWPSPGTRSLTCGLCTGPGIRRVRETNLIPSDLDSVSAQELTCQTPDECASPEPEST